MLENSLEQHFQAKKGYIFVKAKKIYGSRYLETLVEIYIKDRKPNFRI